MRSTVSWAAPLLFFIFAHSVRFDAGELHEDILQGRLHAAGLHDFRPLVLQKPHQWADMNGLAGLDLNQPSG